MLCLSWVVLSQVAYARLPAAPKPWRKATAEKQQDKAATDAQGSSVGPGSEVKPEGSAHGPSEQQQQGGGGTASDGAGGRQLTAKQRRQLKRRQELAARALERDSWAAARAACLMLVEKKLLLQQKPLAFDAALEQVGWLYSCVEPQCLCICKLHVWSV